LAVKNARLTRDRSVGVTTTCWYPNASAASANPTHQSQPSPTSTPNQMNSANTTTCDSVEACSANRRPYRAGTLRTPIRRSISASWQA